MLAGGGGALHGICPWFKELTRMGDGNFTQLAGHSDRARLPYVQYLKTRFD
jgi:hypothetical protein